MLGYTVQVEAAAQPGGFSHFHPWLWARSDHHWFSRRLLLFRTTRKWLLCPLQSFNFLILSGHNSPCFIAVSALALIPISAGPGHESLCLAPESLGPAQVCPGPYQESPGPYPDWPYPVPSGPFLAPFSW